MSKLFLVGIHGKARAGKDTLCGLLRDKWADIGEFSKLSFASPLYAMADIFGFDTMDESFKTEIHPIWGVTGRQFLQKVGTDFFREQFNKDTWIKIASMHLDNLCKNGVCKNLLVVCPDVRFDNEAEMIIGRGGYMVEVVRHNSPGELKGVESAHKSESGISRHLIHKTAFNFNGDLEPMRISADEIVGDIYQQ